MEVMVIIFMIVATIFALASLAYVGIDLLLELRSKEEKPAEPVMVIVEEPVVEEPIIEEPEPEPEVMPEVVEQIEAEEADEMISDTLAMSTVLYESPAGHGQQGITD